MLSCRKDAPPNGGAPVTGVSERQATLHRWAVLNRPRQEPWRARCGESRTPGSASGLGKRTSSNAGTAPQADSTQSFAGRSGADNGYVGLSSASPALRAFTMAAERSETCSLVKMFETWLRTVFRLIMSSWAIVALPLPAAIISSTSRSRSVSDGNAAAVEPAPAAKWSIDPRGDLGPEDRLAGGGRPDGADDLVLVGPLEQVAAGPGAHRGEDGVVVLEHREDDDGRRRRRPRRDAAGRLDAVEVGHPQVHEDHVGAQRCGQLHGARPGLGLADHLDVVDVGEHQLEPAAERRVVVGDEDADHREAPRPGSTGASAAGGTGAHDQAAVGPARDRARAAELGRPLDHRGPPDARVRRGCAAPRRCRRR